MTPFDWEEYLELAEELVRRRGYPAAERSAISRAYYAIFHTAKSHYVANGESLSFLAEDHRTVARWFKVHPNHDLRRIGASIDRLRQWRRDADYEDRFVQLSGEAQAAVVLARRTMDAIVGLGQ